MFADDTLICFAAKNIIGTTKTMNQVLGNVSQMAMYNNLKLKVSINGVKLDTVEEFKYVFRNNY